MNIDLDLDPDRCECDPCLTAAYAFGRCENRAEMRVRVWRRRHFLGWIGTKWRRSCVGCLAHNRASR